MDDFDYIKLQSEIDQYGIERIEFLGGFTFTYESTLTPKILGKFMSVGVTNWTLSKGVFSFSGSITDVNEILELVEITTEV